MAPLQQQADGDGKPSDGSARRKLVAAARAATSFSTASGRVLPTAFFVTDPTRTPDPASVVARLPAGWGVIYRHFGAADRVAVGALLARICRRRRLVLLVSADPELARRIGANGVHWPQARLGGRQRQQPGSPHLIETASAHSRPALIAAWRSGVDAAIISTVFASLSATATAPMGMLRFRGLAKSSPLPVYALGGIGADTAGRIFSGVRTHIAGWAAVEAISNAWK
ncbi:MAG: thiamine phosphate synthase [Alphaproteobacteria bacterium]